MANNPYRNKVELADGTVLMDLTGDTVQAGKMLSGYTAHDASGAQVTGTIPSQAGSTTTPTRSEQTIVSAGTYVTGDIKAGAIPANYYTLAEVFPVGSLYATESSSDDPATILGFGTWTKYAPSPMTWNELSDTAWSSITGVTSGIYVWKRTA